MIPAPTAATRLPPRRIAASLRLGAARSGRRTPGPHARPAAPFLLRREVSRREAAMPARKTKGLNVPEAPTASAEATERLAVLARELHAAAAARLGPDDAPGSADIEAELVEAAHSLLVDLSAQAEAPSLEEGLRRLAAIAAVAGELRRHLAALDRTSRNLLKGHYLSLAVPGFFASYRRWAAAAALVHRRPRPVEEPIEKPRGEDAGPLLDRIDLAATPKRDPLGVLQEISAAAARQLDATAVTGRGAGNLYDRTEGDPRIRLTLKCARLIERLAGPEASTGTDEGLLHRSVNAVWEYALGEIQESAEAALERPVKVVAAARGAIRHYEAELPRGRFLETMTPSFSALLTGIQRLVGGGQAPNRYDPREIAAAIEEQRARFDPNARARLQRRAADGTIKNGKRGRPKPRSSSNNRRP